MGTRARLVVVAGVSIALLGGCGAGGGGTTSARSNSAAATPAAAAPAAGAPVSGAGTGRPAGVPSGPTTVVAKPNACAHNTADRLVRVSLREQHLWMCRRTHLAYSTPITSGIVGEYTHTPTGTYHVQGLDRNTVLTLNTGRQFTVKYWIPFDAPLFGFHDSPWQDFPYGSRAYRTEGSHGCVHMPLAAIRFLYHWADIGTLVRIRG